MYLFCRGSGSTNCLEHYSKWEDPAAGISLSAESNAGLSSEDSDLQASRGAMYNESFCFVPIFLEDDGKNIGFFFLEVRNSSVLTDINIYKLT